MDCQAVRLVDDHCRRNIVRARALVMDNVTSHRRDAARKVVESTGRGVPLAK